MSKRIAKIRCPRCRCNLGTMKEPKKKKTASCKNHGRFIFYTYWKPRGYKPGTQYFVYAAKKEKSVDTVKKEKK